MNNNLDPQDQRAAEAISGILLGFIYGSAIYVAAHRRDHPYSLLGWKLLLLSLLGGSAFPLSVMLQAAYSHQYTEKACAAIFVLAAFPVVLLATSVLATGARIFLFAHLELEKQSLAQAGASGDSEAPAGPMPHRFEAAKEKFLRTWTHGKLVIHAILLALLLVPLVVVLVEVRKSSWRTHTSDPKNLPLCDLQPIRLVMRFVGLVCVVFVLGLWLLLRNKGENFGIKNSYFRLALVTLPCGIAWMTLIDRGVFFGVYFVEAIMLFWSIELVRLHIVRGRQVRSFQNMDAVEQAAEQSLVQTLLRKLRVFFDLTHQKPATELSTRKPAPPLEIEAFLRRGSDFEEFFRFLQREFCSENLLFLQNLSALRESPSPKKALRILELFVLRDAPLEINISSQARSTLTDFAQLLRQSVDPELQFAKPVAGEAELASVLPSSATQPQPASGPDDLAQPFTQAEMEVTFLIEGSLMRFRASFAD
eukprot:TRINITY_DN9414_c0_g1_i2.p1 TRINITY_DN9414_c0_g1~~TRINITY_DN9414_c0_g1_i2.p1  ORF type:complete len:478 (+),score=78.77 TRINITY_DN9414_c0_g1_i2:114-1547(+)